MLPLRHHSIVPALNRCDGHMPSTSDCSSMACLSRNSISILDKKFQKYVSATHRTRLCIRDTYFQEICISGKYLLTRKKYVSATHSTRLCIADTYLQEIGISGKYLFTRSLSKHICPRHISIDVEAMNMHQGHIFFANQIMYQ